MDKTAEILGYIKEALGFVSSVANTPGVNIIPYVSIIGAAAGAIKAGIEAGQNIIPYVEAFKSTFDGDAPTEAEISALDAKIAELEAKVQAAPPPAEEGEPD